MCGKNIITTADTPFVRQLPNVNGKKQATVYFCSEHCKESTYKHHFDGLAWKRKELRDQTRNIKEKNYKYYHEHEEDLRERRKIQYYLMSQDERDKENAYRRLRHSINREEDNKKRREYRAKKKKTEEWKRYVKELNKLEKIGNTISVWA